MTISLAGAQRDTQEMFRELIGEPLHMQSLTDMINGSRLSEVDSTLGIAYELATTSYYTTRLQEKDDKYKVLPDNVVRDSLRMSFPQALGELEKLAKAGRIPSVAFGVMDIVERGLQGRPLTKDYDESSAVKGLYERAKKATTKMESKGITLLEHEPLPHLAPV